MFGAGFILFALFASVPLVTGLLLEQFTYKRRDALSFYLDCLLFMGVVMTIGALLSIMQI